MAEKLKLFIKVLEAELEDLTADFSIVEKKYKEKFEKQEIGNYVYMENEALLLHESECVAFILTRLESLDLSKFSSMESLIDNIRHDVQERVIKGEYAEAVLGFINRKIVKVKTYIENCCV